MDIIKSPNEVEKDFNMEVARLGYQRVLDSVSAIEYTRDNVNQDLLQPARIILDALIDKKKQIKKPFLDANAKVDEAFNQIYKPLLRLVEEKQNQKKRIVDEISREKAAIQAEIARKEELRTKINDYLKRWSEMAYSAETKASLDKLEQSINLAMGRPLEFKELHGPFLEKCKEIKQTIAVQKEKVIQLEEAIVHRNAAYLANDGDAYQKSLEQEVSITSQLRQSREQVLQSAFDNIMGDISVQQMVGPEIKPSRRQWRWEITDMQKLAKKHPELVLLVPNETAIREKMREVKTNGSSEIVMDGIRFFIDEKYK